MPFAHAQAGARAITDEREMGADDFGLGVPAGEDHGRVPRLWRDLGLERADDEFDALRRPQRTQAHGGPGGQAHRGGLVAPGQRDRRDGLDLVARAQLHAGRERQGRRSAVDLGIAREGGHQHRGLGRAMEPRARR